MRPINDTVVVKKIKDHHETESGVELYSGNNSVRYNYGVVVSASDKTLLKSGDKVYYDSIAGSVLRHEGDKLLVLQERDIAIIDE